VEIISKSYLLLFKVQSTNTVWAKPNDILGVTAWNYQQTDGTNPPYNPYITNSYIGLYNSNGVSTSWWMPEPSTGTGGPATPIVDSSSSDITPINGAVGIAFCPINGINELHDGACFWSQFAGYTDGNSYNIRSNAINNNNDWMNPQSPYSNWESSNETITIDGTPPAISISPNEQNSSSAINVNVTVTDFAKNSTSIYGSGIQYYEYTVLENGATIQDSGKIYPAEHSSLTGALFGDNTGECAPGNGIYAGITDTEADSIQTATPSMSTTVPLSGAGTYQVKVTAVDNLGNQSTQTSGNYVLTGGGGGSTSSGSKGTITFVPNSTPWTNTGKIAGFPVQVITTNPIVQETWEQNYTITATTTNTTTNADGSTSTSTSTSTSSASVPFTVTYQLSNLSITGNCTPTTLPSSGGTIYVKEGANSVINATANYVISNKQTPTPPSPSSGGNTSYSVSPTTVTQPANAIVTNPSISGTSGSYNVDYTNPILTMDNPSTLWVNHILNVNIDGYDPQGQYNPSGQSGLKSAAWAQSDSSHYGRNSNGSFAGNSQITLNDGIYSLSLNDSDIAGNTNSLSRNTYYVDTTPPTCTFSVAEASPSRIFQGSGVIVKPSVNGTGTGLFGTLTLSDNLSGVASSQYCWTFGSSDSTGTYKTIYTSPYTYNDRSSESLPFQIEKPVGDNLYLHVKEYDTAGNYTYSTFGPYEDPIALKNFEVTDIRDPDWDSVFWQDPTAPYPLGFTKPTGVTFPVSKLPIDNTSNPIYSNAEVKKGYAFYFDITTNYMYRDNDYIEMKPNFYYWDGKTRTPVDMYYQLNNNPFIKFGSTQDTVTLNMDTAANGYVGIGNLPLLTLTKGVRIVSGNEFYGTDGWQNKIQYSDGKTQWWYGKYFIPASSVFVPVGESPRPENILSNNHIIVNFDIIGYKNGIETLSQDQIYNYVNNNWTAEGGPKNANYQPGDVMVYDNSKSLLDDYTTLTTH
jgi:hypothetical protein